MEKKLIFSFFVSEDTYGSKINDIHFNCLSRYRDVFDCADITLIVNSREDNCMDFAYDAETRFLRIFRGKNINFSIIDNNEFRESRVFYDKVATQLGNNELVFFAHNKGVSNVSKYDERQIYAWVCGMYYYSLNFMQEVNYQLVERKFFSYGSFLTKNDEPERYNKYGWYYVGTFFWINCKKLYQYMTMHGIPVPVLADRYYDEEFLGNIINTWPMIMTGSHEDKYLRNCCNFYEEATEYLRLLSYSDSEAFDKFYHDMVLA